MQRKSLYKHLRNEHGSDAEVKAQHLEQKKAKMEETKKRVAEEKAKKKNTRDADKQVNRQPRPFDFAKDLNRGQVRIMAIDPPKTPSKFLTSTRQ